MSVWVISSFGLSFGLLLPYHYSVYMFYVLQLQPTALYSLLALTSPSHSRKSYWSVEIKQHIITTTSRQISWSKTRRTFSPLCPSTLIYIFTLANSLSDAGPPPRPIERYRLDIPSSTQFAEIFMECLNLSSQVKRSSFCLRYPSSSPQSQFFYYAIVPMIFLTTNGLRNSKSLRQC